MSLLDPGALNLEQLLSREWLLADGLGGYASSTVIGLNTRKYHGLLVAALAPPVRRTVILSRVEEFVIVNGKSVSLASVEYPGVIHPAGYLLLRAFNAQPFPRWAFQSDGWTIEKSVQFNPIRPNEVVVSYALLGGEKSVELEIRPLFALRGVHDLMYQSGGRLEAEALAGGRTHRIAAGARTPEVFFAHDGVFDGAAHWYLSTVYRRERDRGYAGLEDLWMPGAIRFALAPGKTAYFAVALARFELGDSLDQLANPSSTPSRPFRAGYANKSERPSRAQSQTRDDQTAELLARAAEPFIIASSATDLASWTSIMPQYPWTPLAVRDMLIAFDGILLLNEKFDLARALLLRLAGSLKDGLIPSEFDEQAGDPAYNACDNSLWLIHCIWRYVETTGKDNFARDMLPVIESIVGAYQRGARHGIAIDADGLVRVRSSGVGCTWMNAKIGDWVITPRHGRCVEVNALWYNALCIAADFSRRIGADKSIYRAAADVHRSAFNRRFWNEAGACCFDVLYDHGADTAVRPNQLLAASLPFAVLDASRWPAMLQTVRDQLLTPMGVRTLSRDDLAYQGVYAGDVVNRDRAYHQGSAFPWLLGAYASVAKRVLSPTDALLEIRKSVRGCLEYLRDAGMGTLPELFDGDAPHRAGGAVADARSVGEVARAWRMGNNP